MSWTSTDTGWGLLDSKGPIFLYVIGLLLKSVMLCLYQVAERRSWVLGWMAALHFAGFCALVGLANTVADSGASLMNGFTLSTALSLLASVLAYVLVKQED